MTVLEQLKAARNERDFVNPASLPMISVELLDDTIAEIERLIELRPATGKVAG